MNIGILKEDFKKESRVALTPAGVQSLIETGNIVYVEKNAGLMCQFSDEDYEAMGAKIVYSAEELIGRSEIIVRVHPPNESDIDIIEDSKIIFSFLHLEIAGKKVMEQLAKKKITSIGYELIEDRDGRLPIQEVSSEISGKMAIPIAQKCLESTSEGRGILLSGIPGVPPAAIVVLGAGVVGRAALRAALGVGAQCSVLDSDLKKLRRITEMFPGAVTTALANSFNIERAIKYADVFISCVKMRGVPTPHLISEEMVIKMKRGAVLIDISIDQGGTVETSRPTTLNNPTFIKHGVIHYCVPNIPSSVARTATYGITNTSVHFISAVAKEGIENAMEKYVGLAKGVCTLNGRCVKESLKQLYNL